MMSFDNKELILKNLEENGVVTINKGGASELVITSIFRIYMFYHVNAKSYTIVDDISEVRSKLEELFAEKEIYLVN